MKEDVARNDAVARGGSDKAKRNGANGSVNHKGEHFTDLGNARRLVRIHGNNIRFVHAFNSWFIWSGQHWQRDEDGGILRLAKLVVEGLFEEAAKVEDENIKTAMRKHALISQGRDRITAMVKLAESELPVVLSYKKLDADPMLLGVQNGVIELKTGTFRDGRREDYVTMRCNVAYDPNMPCPEWINCQNLITGRDEAMIAYKRRVTGLLLTGKIQETLFIPWGDGNNGKSTELETYQAILGDYAHATDASLLLARKETSGPTPEIVVLKGKRAVFINETPENARLNEARVKYLTGKDTLYGRGLHEKPINFFPSHKIIMRTNHRPIIRGTDRGIWRRIHLIPYTTIIEGGEEDFREQKLMPELSGILNWMLQGLKDYQKQGLNPPKAVCDATDRFREEMDLVAQWLEARCMLDRDLEMQPEKPNETTLKRLAKDFNEWAKDEIRRPWPNVVLSEKLKKLGLNGEHTRAGFVFYGICFLPAETYLL